MDERVNECRLNIPRLRGFLDCLEGHVRDGTISPKMMGITFAAYFELWVATDYQVEIPDIGPTEDGHIFLIWNTPMHYLEIEIFQDGLCEAFYTNRREATLWSAEYNIGDTISPEIVEKLQLFSGDREASGDLHQHSV